METGLYETIRVTILCNFSEKRGEELTGSKTRWFYTSIAENPVSSSHDIEKLLFIHHLNSGFWRNGNGSGIDLASK